MKNFYFCDVTNHQPVYSGAIRNVRYLGYACVQNGHPVRAVLTFVGLRTSPCPPYFALREAKRDSKGSDPAPDFIDRLLGTWKHFLTFVFAFPILMFGSSCSSNLTVQDPDGTLSLTTAPVVETVTLTKKQMKAAREGRLGLSVPGADPEAILPVQWKLSADGSGATGIFLLPEEEKGKHRFHWGISVKPFAPAMKASGDAKGQIWITDKGKKVLRYNYRTVYEEDAYAFHGLPANEYVPTPNDTFMRNPSIYAVPRSDYIHPLFGPEGEILTRDWSRDHPHHRGIYWAWPEVDWGKKRGDLHALQKVFARPTGKIKFQGGPVYAQIEAENVWVWEGDSVPIVREIALIRAYRQTERGRVIDLIFKFTGLKDSITIARRHTDAYGGLNIRLMTPENQDLSYFTDKPDAVPRRAWSDLSGLFPEAKQPSGLMVLQNENNPEYPGEWAEYPDLSWVQPTFPSSGTRYLLKPGQPLILRFRLIVHPGMRPEVSMSEMLWDAYHSDLAPQPGFTL